MGNDVHAQHIEAEMDVVALPVTGDEAEDAEPGMCPLHLSAMSAEAVTKFDAVSCNTWRDAAAASAVIIARIGVQRVWTALRTPGLPCTGGTAPSAAPGSTASRQNWPG